MFTLTQATFTRIHFVSKNEDKCQRIHVSFTRFVYTKTYENGCTYTCNTGTYHKVKNVNFRKKTNVGSTSRKGWKQGRVIVREHTAPALQHYIIVNAYSTENAHQSRDLPKT